MRLRSIALITAFATSLFVSLASSTTVIPMSVERLTQASTHVLVGNAEKSWTQWNPEHTVIFTYTQFHVARALKGFAPATVVIKQMGGRADGYEQRVAGVRQFRDGEQAVVFLHPSMDADGTLVITGLMQGNFRVVAAKDSAGPRVTNGIAGVNKFDPATGALEHFSGRSMSISRLETLVRSAQAQKDKQ